MDSSLNGCIHAWKCDAGVVETVMPTNQITCLSISREAIKTPTPVHKACNIVETLGVTIALVACQIH